MATKRCKKPINWDAVEIDYRAGILSIRQIARNHGCAHPTIREHAKRHGWERDLGAKVRQRTKEVLERQEAAAAGREPSTSHAHATGRVEGEAEAEAIVDAAARTQVEVVRGHRQAIAKAYKIAEALFTELMVGTEGAATVDDLIAVVTANDDNGTRRRPLEKLTGLGTRSGAMRQLTASLRDLVTLERQAFGLDDDDAGNKGDGFIPIEERVKAYAREKAIAEAGDKVVDIGKPATLPSA